MFFFQTMFDWLDNTVIKLCNMSPVGTDLCTVKEQLNEMKVCAKQDISPNPEASVVIEAA